MRRSTRAAPCSSAPVAWPGVSFVLYNSSGAPQQVQDGIDGGGGGGLAVLSHSQSSRPGLGSDRVSHARGTAANRSASSSLAAARGAPRPPRVVFRFSPMASSAADGDSVPPPLTAISAFTALFGATKAAALRSIRYIEYRCSDGTFGVSTASSVREPGGCHGKLLTDDEAGESESLQQ